MFPYKSIVYEYEPSKSGVSDPPIHPLGIRNDVFLFPFGGGKFLYGEMFHVKRFVIFFILLAKFDITVK